MPWHLHAKLTASRPVAFYPTSRVAAFQRYHRRTQWISYGLTSVQGYKRRYEQQEAELRQLQSDLASSQQLFQRQQDTLDIIRGFRQVTIQLRL